MGIITNPGRETNWSAKEIREVPKVVGDTSPVAGSLVKRDKFGNIIDYWIVDENTDIVVRRNTQYVITKIGGLSQHIVMTDADGTSDDLAILIPIGDYFRLGFTGDTAILEMKAVV